MAANDPTPDSAVNPESPTHPVRHPIPGGGAVDPFAATLAPPDGSGQAGPDSAPPPDGRSAGAVGDTDQTNAVTVSLVGGETVTVPTAPTPPPDLPGYQILAELGRGGMGVVYHARQTRLGRDVALKMILAGEYAGADARVRFLAEAEVIAKLQHPNIVQLFEFNVYHGVPYFSLEFVDGGTLDRKLAKQPLPAGEAAGLIETLARAVHYAHERGVVHRDLKPGNVLLQCRPAAPGSHPPAAGGSHPPHRSGHGDASFGTLSCVVRDASYMPKITDFGLAKSVAGGGGLTQTGAVMGTPSYMAPEQAGGRSREVGPAADTYALGALLYECLTGRPPFQAATPVDTIMQVVREDPVPPRRLQSKVPKDLETICLKCLHKDPGKRYGTAQDLADDLARYLNGEAIKARPVGPVERAVRWARRRPAAAALVAVLVGGGVAVGAAGWVTSARLGEALADARDQRREADDQRAVAVAQAAEADRQRREADGQRAAALAQAAEADRQRQAVADGLRKRLDMVDDILFNFDARLANHTGLESIRREFLDDVRKLSEQLLKESPDDPAVARQAGRVYRNIGELTLRGEDYKESEAAFDRAVALEQSLADRFPGQPEYQADLALTTYRRALMYWYARKLPAADAGFAASAGLYDRLAPLPGQRDAAVRGARVVYYRANVRYDRKDPAGAVAGLREALARQEKLAARPDADVLEDLGNTAGMLALAVEAADPEESARLLRRAKTAYTTAARLAPHSTRVRTRLRNAFDDLSAFCQRHHRDADLAALARQYAAAGGEQDTGTYNAACYFALAAKAAAGNPALPPAERADRADRYARQAVEYLDRAIEQGFTDRAHLLKDTDLDGLRDRADYKAFLARMDKRFPGRPVTPADLLKSLEEEFDTAKLTSDALRRSALTAAEKRRAARAEPDFPGFATRVLKLAEENPDSPAALDALAWVLDTGHDRPGPAAKGCCDRALRGLARYAGRAEFMNACRVLGDRPTAAGDDLLRAAAAGHPDPDVRGVAAYALGLSLAKQAEAAPPGGDRQAGLFQTAEALFERVGKEFAGVTYKDSTLGALAPRKLTEVRSLSVGRRAREIDGTDLAGKPLKLSAYRGKVTLVFFWANWCGYCRQFFPQTRDLADRYRGQPFAIVGVNSDDEKPAADRAVAREKLAWPSWWDGGPAGGRITEQWQVGGYPTLYLIDPAGVIRHKWEGKPEVDEVREAIDALVAEAGKGKS